MLAGKRRPIVPRAEGVLWVPLRMILLVTTQMPGELVLTMKRSGRYKCWLLIQIEERRRSVGVPAEDSAAYYAACIPWCIMLNGSRAVWWPITRPDILWQESVTTKGKEVVERTANASNWLPYIHRDCAEDIPTWQIVLYKIYSFSIPSYLTLDILICSWVDSWFKQQVESSNMSV